MKRSGGFFLRVLIAISGLALAGLVLKLIGSILTPILPASFNSALSSGWTYLLGLVNPALPAIGALAILALLLWIVAGRGR
ncbi:hypothetical protein ABH935_007167 [Catenulispora sp. GAS73]|uniref:hypothetical protein n=1 Tax=Catenulispora sp. GAS73 TaxID=3156269 RepID=UPI003516C34B